VRIATGIRSLDALLQGAWYQMQLDRMGRGLEPDPTLGRLRALFGYFRPRRGHDLDRRAPTRPSGTEPAATP
jgi:hypothetical protein